ncbi:MAG: hypothetical protein KCHDKBKB_01784 [Elusimicrobia bacterium]|nr:hypothetical protein [Elusimicrobiota bacterium]
MKPTSGLLIKVIYSYASKALNSMKRVLVFGFIFMSLPCLQAEMSLKKVAAELAAQIRKQGPTTVAVLALPHHDNHKSDGPMTISEILASNLAADNKFTVVERHKLNQALSELRLSTTGMIDPQTAKAIGQMLGAEVIVTGTLINLPDDMCEVNVRALLAKNGRVIAAERTTLERTWKDKRVLN